MIQPPSYLEHESAVIKYLKDPDISYQQIADLFKIKINQVAYIAKKNNIQRRPRVKEPDDSVVVLSQVDREIQEMEQKLRALREKRQELEIQFEASPDGLIFIYGVAPEGLAANYKDWLRFLKNNGAAKLREFIQKKYGSGEEIPATVKIEETFAGR